MELSFSRGLIVLFLEKDIESHELKEIFAIPQKKYSEQVEGALIVGLFK